MTYKIALPATLALTVATLGTSLPAQTVLSGDHSVDGSLCAGSNCTGSESFVGADLKIKVFNPELLFEDVSGSDTPDRDWRILTNEGGVENFVIEDVDALRDVFVIEGNSQPNSLYVSNSGYVGLGTSLPQRELHILGGGQPTIRFQNTSTSWDIRTNSNYIWFQNEPSGTFPFVVSSEAPTNALWISDTGNVGLGTQDAQAPLELLSFEGFNFFRITATAATNPSVDITYTGGPLGTGQLRYNIVDGDNQEMSLDADGNLVIDGTLTTSGPTCAGGCDRVFEAEYPLLAIKDRAALMHAKGHLPAIGPTQPDAPLNVSETLGAVINELEHAHIYIAQLEDKHSATQTLLLSEIASLTARLEAIEAK